MRNSLKLFAVRGIDIRLHVTFPLILLWAAFQFGAVGGVASALFGVIAVLLLFVLVTLHELGHSFAAQYYGVPVKQIVLSPIGGVAQLQRIPDNPVQEFVIAIAGPAVNFVAAIVMGIVVWGLDINLLSPLAVLTGAGGVTLAALFSYVFIYNIFLGVFNLLPAFPMDGGRVLRSLLAMRLDYARATNIAATIGRLFAFLLGIYGLFNGGIFLVLIAVFIYMAAGQEAQLARLRNSLRGYTVRHVYAPDVYRLSPYNTLQQAVNLSLTSGQSTFPVCEGTTFLGLLTRSGLREAIQTQGPATWVRDVMRRDVKPVSLATDLFDVYLQFGEKKVEALPVVENGRFLGLVTQQNLFDFHRWSTIEPKIITGVRSASAYNS